MTINASNQTDRLNYALHLIDRLPSALLHHIAPLASIHQRLHELDGRTCTGNPHWRDKNAAGKTAKLYILHRTDQTCPVHGAPPSAGRLRVYIGNKPDLIAEALAAIERNTERHALELRRSALHSAIGSVTYTIKSVYRRLAHYPPEPGQDPQPVPSARD